MRDIFEIFDTVHVVRMADWEEIRLKGEFITFCDFEHEDFTMVISKYYYVLELDQIQEVFIYVHQEPFYNEFVGDFRPVLNIGVVVYRVNKDGSLSFKNFIPFCRGQKVGTNYTFTPGMYYFIVVTSTNLLYFNPAYEGTEIELVTEEGSFSLKMVDTLKEMYRLFDTEGKQSLDFESMRLVFEALGI